MNKLAFYIHCFTNLNVSKSKGVAPNKPILILSIIDLIDKGYIDNCWINISPELVETFRKIWMKLVFEDRDMIFALPFFHMKSEKFWQLRPKQGYEKAVSSVKSIRSLGSLREMIDCAKLDDDLFIILAYKVKREIIIQEILNKYFPNSKQEYSSLERNLFSFISLEEEPESYKQEILSLKASLNKNRYQEEVFVRSGAFKRMITQNYNDRCAISGMKLTATTNISMLDACHIVPFAESYDDTPSNGIALTPTLHRAFDRGLISISEDYKVLLNDNFKEDTSSPYNLTQFGGLSISLPYSKKYYPSQENLRFHREHFGFKFH
ncbi:MAG: HNH endonuclease [Vicingaceae bacterium]